MIGTESEHPEVEICNSPCLLATKFTKTAINYNLLIIFKF